SRRRHTRSDRDWSSDVCSSDLSDFAGTIFSRDSVQGTFPLSTIHIDTPDAADVVMSFRWSEENNQFGVPGMIDADWNRKAGEGRSEERRVGKEWRSRVSRDQ